jgi:hypothetical protein
MVAKTPLPRLGQRVEASTPMPPLRPFAAAQHPEVEVRQQSAQGARGNHQRESHQVEPQGRVGAPLSSDGEEEERGDRRADGDPDAVPDEEARGPPRAQIGREDGAEETDGQARQQELGRCHQLLDPLLGQLATLLAGHPGGEERHQDGARDEGSQVVDDHAEQDGPGAKALEDPGGLYRRRTMGLHSDAFSSRLRSRQLTRRRR